MSLVIPCLRGMIGSTSYFQANVKARELMGLARPVAELPGLGSAAMDDRIHRDPNMARVAGEIAPVYANVRDRFYGALILLILDGDVVFEALADLGTGLPGAYRNSAHDLGFLTLTGGQLALLDGQHRFLALEKVVKREIVGLNSDEVVEDQVPVILIQHETRQKTRRIFNTLNRYARPTSRIDDIVTSEDDGYAIVARRLAGPAGPFSSASASALVGWRRYAVTPSSREFVTISTLYDSVRMLLDSRNGPRFDIRFCPDDDQLREAFDLVHRFWCLVTRGIDTYREALAHPRRIPEMRKPSEPGSLLLESVGQLVLVSALAAHSDPTGRRLDLAVKRVNAVDWRTLAPQWRGVLVRQDGRLTDTPSGRQVAAEIVRTAIGLD